MKLKLVKNTFFALLTILLLLVWKTVFILQGGIGYQGNILLLPFKLLPIFLYSSLITWILLKIFDQNKKVPSRKNASFSLGGLAVILSLTFQYFSISSKMKPFTFNNKMFSHLKPVSINNDFKNRMILSSAEYLRLMPLGSMDGDSTSYIANVAAEASLIFEVKKLIDDKNIQNTCKSYIERNGDYNSCIIDFQKDIYSKYQFTSTGNILLVAVGALGTFKIKKLMTEKYGEKDIYIITKSANDVIETSMLSAEKSKTIILSKDKSLQFSMGHNLRPDSILATIERQINYKFLLNHLEKIGSLLSNVDKKLAKIDMESEKTQKRSISSLELLELEKTRLRKLKDRHASFQRNGFNIDAIKLKQKEMNKELEVKLEQLKEESLLFKISAFFNPSLNEMTIDDLMKKKAPSESNNDTKNI